MYLVVWHFKLEVEVGIGFLWPGHQKAARSSRCTFDSQAIICVQNTSETVIHVLGKFQGLQAVALTY